jgi:predicted hydrocarbon binding protein
MKKNVFVSYTHDDKRVADALVKHLETRGIPCFIAPRDIDPGKPYASNLMRAIDDCTLVLLIASNAINDSDHVLNEVDAIVNKKKDILPIFIEDFEMNADYRYYLGRKQWVIAYPDAPQAYFDKIVDSVLPFIPQDELPTAPAPTPKAAEPDKNSSTVFEYIPSRGIMINPEDHQRNVSFRTDSLINMLGGIYEKVAEIADEKQAEEIFYNSGFTSGKNFAERINNQWDTGYTVEDMRQKLQKWCQFDSAVGWGHFSSEIEVDEEQDKLTGTIRINEPFIVDNTKKRKICGFIRGYCEGVVETLLNSIDVELTCKECPLQSKFRCACVFNISSKG